MVNILILIGWVLRVLKIVVHFWYVTFLLIIFLVIYIYIDHQKHKKKSIL